MEFSTEKESLAARLIRNIHEGGRRTVFADGEIVSGDTDRFVDFIRKSNISSAKIVLNSPGGSLIEGLMLGRAIRDFCFDTEIGERSGAPAMCASAAAYAYAGGFNRYYSKARGLLGVHQFSGAIDSDVNVVTSKAQEISGVIIEYLTQMGVDALAFSMSTRATSNAMVWLSEDEAQRLGFSNNGILATTAEIKLTDGKPYLKLEQSRDAGCARVLLFYDENRFHLMAGIVTDPEQSAFHCSISQRSYIELDHEEFLEAGPGGLFPEGSVLWLERELDVSVIRKILESSKLDIWTEGGGAIRWGGGLDLFPVRNKITDFVRNYIPVP